MKFRLVIAALSILILIPYNVEADDKKTWIIEVDRDPHEVKYYIEAYHPLVEVEFVYDTILQGLAVTGDERHIQKLYQEQFIQEANEVLEYVVPNDLNNPSPDDLTELNNLPKTEPGTKQETNPENIAEINPENKPESNLETNPDNHPNNSKLNPSISTLKQQNEVNYHPHNLPYTGKGVKVGVIDTGIDYRHPDLIRNFKGGFDVVDFDEDPMETTVEEGIPTIHGTHVAGIIASNGKMTGVAPDADIYAYRALGPGGSGTTAHVMAALEKAVKDGMDIVNMSLGSSVNSPDDPMTKAVSRAIELGTTVVVANGNSGPNNWTVGSPATSDEAISVGAAIDRQKIPQIAISQSDNIAIRQIPFSEPWQIKKPHPIIIADDTIEPSIHDRIILIEKNGESYDKIIQKIVEIGATALIIYSDEDDDPNEWDWIPAPFPVAYVTEEEVEKIKEEGNWLETTYETITDDVAAFSSRGPVTSTWQIKPDILAPGVDIMSTVPDGYASLQGTSMAAPYIAGVLALLKEADPSATPKQLKARLLQASDLLVEEEGNTLPPTFQGNGHVNIDEALDKNYTIHDSRLDFGKISEQETYKTEQITIKNNANQPLPVRFNQPKRQTGLTWNVPFSQTLNPNEEKTFTFEVMIQNGLLDEGLFEGYLDIEIGGETQSIPYLLMHETSDYPRIAGVELEMQPFQNDDIKMRLYAPEALDELTIHLYDNYQIHQKELLHLKDISQGYIEHILQRTELPSGSFQAVIIARQGDEEFTHIQDVQFP